MHNFFCNTKDEWFPNADADADATLNLKQIKQLETEQGTAALAQRVDEQRAHEQTNGDTDGVVIVN